MRRFLLTILVILATGTLLYGLLNLDAFSPWLLLLAAFVITTCLRLLVGRRPG